MTVSGLFGSISYPVLVFAVLGGRNGPDRIPSKAIRNTTANELSGNCLGLHVAYIFTNNISVPNIQLKREIKDVLLWRCRDTAGWNGMLWILINMLWQSDVVEHRFSGTLLLTDLVLSPPWVRLHFMLSDHRCGNRSIYRLTSTSSLVKTATIGSSILCFVPFKGEIVCS